MPRHFSRIRVFALSATLLLFLGTAASAETLLPLPSSASALITSPLDPSNYVVTPPSAFDGVGKLIVTLPSGTFGCSGTLLTGGQYVVTSAHCVTDGGPTPAVSALTATFDAGGGPQTFSGAAYYVPPGWTGFFEDGSDIALVKLAAPALGIPGYELWRNADPAGAIDVAGYGLGGLGTTGSTGGTFGTLRAGQNSLESVVWTIPGLPYAWDFDDGTAAHDALCVLLGVCNLGLGDQEVMIAPGDSGGPLFFDGFLAGVHSFGATFGPPVDIDGTLNASFGELAGDTRVNFYAAWIDSIVVVPEPGSWILLGGGLALLLSAVRRRRGA